MVLALEVLQVHLGAERRTKVLPIFRGLSFTSHLYLATEIRKGKTLDGEDSTRGGGMLGHSKVVF